uniref:NADH-ubiquinone oxidoreductase chain 4 n=1 Tax=Storeatula sp. CCMP1868 TaxID=195070 RepID=A0A2P1G876_9CRYP|nr:NADH dehydrogenase subunit 4 [Storeatula sp. CCMP1868]AVM81143.1 NADH dehydrogenase subunit 4 [Storeatula sp. CCMP1868]
MSISILSLMLLFLLSGIFVILLIPAKNQILIKQSSYVSSICVFICSLSLLTLFDSSSCKFQFVEWFELLTFFNFNFFIGIDGISIFFILLTTFLIPICLLIEWFSKKKNVKEYHLCFLLMNLFLIIVFSVLDILIFYIFFESILIPMFLVVGIFGSKTRRIKAAYQFFLYTLIGSLLMLLSIFLIFFETGSTDFQILLNFEFSEKKQFILWLAFFISFAIKIPMFPLHIWLPEAHVEAPTAGSVILAGVLLKMGAYGFVRFSLTFFPIASIFFSPLIFLLSLLAVLYTSLSTLRQIDLKKAIAYSSVAHMGIVTIGIFSFNLYGLEGSFLMMISHGFVSSALFLLVGMLYEKHHTRLIKYYGGIVQLMPIYSLFFLFFSIANLGFPGTSSFCAEFLILFGAFQINTFLALFSSLGMVFSAAYCLWLSNRLLFGQLKISHISNYYDLQKKDFAILFPLSFFTLILGIYPETFLDIIHVSVSNIL